MLIQFPLISRFWCHINETGSLFFFGPLLIRSRSVISYDIESNCLYMATMIIKNSESNQKQGRGL